MTLVIQITEERLQQLIAGAAEQGAEKAFMRLNKELRLQNLNWIDKAQALDMLNVSGRTLSVLVIIGAIKTNDAGKGKVIMYDRKSILEYGLGRKEKAIPPIKINYGNNPFRRSGRHRYGTFCRLARRQRIQTEVWILQKRFQALPENDERLLLPE